MSAISLMVASLVILQSPAEEMRLTRFPSVAGDTVAFCHAGDIWTASLSGGMARRVTTLASEEQRPKLSPDGKWIAFTAAYDGTPDLYIMPVEGGEPKRLTFEPGAEFALFWTKENKIAYTSSYGNHVGQARLWMISPKGGFPERTNVAEINQGSMMADGKTLVYHRQPVNMQWWRYYRGGLHGWISIYNLATNEYSELPHGRENSWFPMAIGDAIYYISDKTVKGVNLYRYDTKSKATRQLTNYEDTDIRWPSSDGKTIVWERDGLLYKYDVASNQVSRIVVKMVGEHLGARPRVQNLGQSLSNLTLSPSGNRVVVEARGELFSVPARTGDTRNLSETPGARESVPAWSPDGKWIAYTSDIDGEVQVYVKPQMGGTAEKLTDRVGLNVLNLQWSPDGKMLGFITRSSELFVLDIATKKLTLVVKDKYASNSPFDWSPDSKWVAYVTTGDNQFGRVWVYNVEEGKATPVSSKMYPDNDVAWDMNGKYLYFTSNRTYQSNFGTFEFILTPTNSTRLYMIPLTKDMTNPLIPGSDEEGERPAGSPAGGPVSVKIDFEGIENRAIVLPMGAGNYSVLTGLNDGFLYFGDTGLQMFNLRSRDSQMVLPAFSGAAVNASKTKIAFAAQGGLFISDLRPGLQPGPGRVDLNGCVATIDPRQEWKQMLREAWRLNRDNFYDPNMLGIDWNMVEKRYSKYLDSVNSRNDLGYVIGLMISELGTGHAYIQNFDIPVTNPVPVGYLGADYEAYQGKIRFKKVYQGLNYEEANRAPLGEPGVNVKDGDYLLAINGKPVDASINPNSLLVGTVGRAVVLTVGSSPDPAAARTVRVRPVASESGLRLSDWVNENRRKVSEMSNGRIGYAYVPNTGFEGAIGVIKGFYSQIDKDAVLIDERWNGGGFIQPWFVDTFARKMRSNIYSRHGEVSADAVAIEGPKCLLINGYAGSGGDFFPWMFRQSKLGPLIGMRTWGGLVGIRGYFNLMDGGLVTSPEFGFMDRETGKWVAENQGVDADIQVDARPDLIAKGQDPILERGVEYLLNELKKGKKQDKVGPFMKPRDGGN